MQDKYKRQSSVCSLTYRTVQHNETHTAQDGLQGCCELYVVMVLWL